MLMSLLLAANESSSEKENDIKICTFFSFKLPFFITLLLFIIVCAVLSFIFFKIHETAGSVIAFVSFLGYLGGLINEFSDGHIGHGVIMLIVLAVFIGLCVIGCMWNDEGSTSKNNTQNKNGTGKAPPPETITEDDLKRINEKRKI